MSLSVGMIIPFTTEWKVIIQSCSKPPSSKIMGSVTDVYCRFTSSEALRLFRSTTNSEPCLWSLGEVTAARMKIAGSSKFSIFHRKFGRSMEYQLGVYPVSIFPNPFSSTYFGFLHVFTIPVIDSIKRNWISLAQKKNGK